MKKSPVLIIPFLLLALWSHAQLPPLAVSAIPDSLKKNASVVKRYENIYFEVTDIDRAYLKKHEIYTVLKEDGASALVFRSDNVGKFVTLENAEIKVYDAGGKEINKFKKKDLATYSLGSGLIDDGKTFVLRVPAPSYPITVEYITEQKYKGSLFFPEYLIITPEEGIQQSTFTARVPKNLDLRYKESNIKLAPKVSEDDKYKTYQWSVANLAPIDYEPGAVSYRDRYPAIKLAATRFKMDDYEGDMTTWKGLGLWYNLMHKGLEVLPDDRKAFFQNLVKDARDEREKVRIIYDYLQKNFRYVNISLGIGGWRSLPATFTDQKKYGDCKGLTNFMYAALKAVGIRSHPALINSDYNEAPIDPAFPMSAFDHVILCVPQPKDSIWLECTSKTTDFAVLGTFTENRNALLITEEGGVLVATPSSKASDNRFDVATTVAIQPDGSGKVVSTFRTTGEYKEMIGHVIDEKKDDQKDFIINGMGYKQPDEFSLIRKEATGTMETELAMLVEKVPEFIAGNKMFLSPRLYKLSGTKLPVTEKRRMDFYFHNPYQKTDTTVIQLPEGFAVDALPQTKEISCPLASYKTKCWYEEGKRSVISTTTLVLSQHRIPAAEYASVKKFFDEVAVDDAQRIVIKKQ